MAYPPRIVLVCGGRKFEDRELLTRTLDHARIDALLHGGATGADQMAGNWALSKGIPEIMMNANWRYYDRGAGPLRNEWMIRFIAVEEVIAFPGGKGTRHMCSIAGKKGIPVTRINWE